MKNHKWRIIIIFGFFLVISTYILFIIDNTELLYLLQYIFITVLYFVIYFILYFSIDNFKMIIFQEIIFYFFVIYIYRLALSDIRSYESHIFYNDENLLTLFFVIIIIIYFTLFRVLNPFSKR